MHKTAFHYVVEQIRYALLGIGEKIICLCTFMAALLREMLTKEMLIYERQNKIRLLDFASNRLAAQAARASTYLFSCSCSYFTIFSILHNFTSLDVILLFSM